MPSGEVSVMPQACTILRPCFFSKPSIIYCGAAAPPTTVRAQRAEIVALFFQQSEQAQPERGHAGGEGDFLGLDQLGQIARLSSAGRERPILLPTIAQANGVPQAMTWNIGTTGRKISRSHRPSESAIVRPRQCR